MPKKKSVKIPTAVQLPSGSWRVRLRSHGECHSITRPTEKEAIAAAMAIQTGLIQAEVPAAQMTLAAAIESYIADREEVKSPSTIAGYRVIQRNRFKSIQLLRLKDLTQARWQQAVNQEKKLVGSKTLKNSASFVQSVVYEKTGVRLTSSLAQVVTEERCWLDPDQILVFIRVVHGNPYEIPLLLALEGLRKSELISLRWRDINLDRGTITVHGSAVLDSEGHLIDRQENKNTSSRRVVRFLIPQLREAVSSQPRDPAAYIYHKSNNVLSNNCRKLCVANGLPPVTLHGLRHTFASLCAYLRIPEKITMEMGGWSNYTVVHSIYTHASQRQQLEESKLLEGFYIPLLDTKGDTL